MNLPRGIDAGDQPLGRRFFITGRAVELSGAEKAGEVLELQRRRQRRRVHTVILDGVRRADDLDVLQARDGLQKRQLHIFGQGRGKPLQIELLRVQPAGLDEDLVPLLFREADDLVLDGRAVPRADALDLPTVQRRTFQIGKDDVLRLRTRISDITDCLVRRRYAFVVGKTDRLFVSVLDLQRIQVHRTRVDARWRAGLEAAGLHAEAFQRNRELGSGEEPVRAGFIGHIAHVDAAAEEGAGCQDDRVSRIDSLQFGGQLPAAFVVPAEVDDLRLTQVEVFGGLQHVLHVGGVVPPVDLRAGRVDRRPLAEVQHAGLDEVPVRGPGHLSAEGVDLPDQVALGRAADGRVAGHVAHPVGGDGEDGRPAAKACGGQPRLDSGVARADDGDFIMSGVILQWDGSFISPRRTWRRPVR